MKATQRWSMAGPQFAAIHILALAALLFGAASLEAPGRRPILPQGAVAQGVALAGALGYGPAADPVRARVLPAGPPEEVAERGSPVYDLLCYVLTRAGGARLVMAAQSLALAVGVYLFVRVLAPRKPLAAFYAAAPVLASGSGLIFCLASPAPDGLTGAALACLTALMLAPHRLTGAERLTGLCVTALAVAADPSAALLVLILVALWPLALALTGETGAAILPGVRRLVTAGFCGLSVGVLCNDLLAHHNGGRTGSPPRLMARVLEDGPGRDYLAAVCPEGAAPVLCRFKDRPLDRAEDVLWSKDPAHGVYASARPSVRLALRREEPAFVIAAVSLRPLGEARAIGGRWLGQLRLVGDEEDGAPPSTGPPGAGGGEPRGGAPWTRALRLATRLALASSLAAVAALGFGDLRSAARVDAWMRRDCALCLRGLLLSGIAILGNGLACAALGDPAPLGSARVLFLLPLGAVCLAFTLPWKAAWVRARARTDPVKAITPAAPRSF